MILHNLWVHMKERKYQQNGPDFWDSEFGLPLKSKTTFLSPWLNDFC